MRWETRERSTGRVLGKVRMIAGMSLRGDCKLHSTLGKPCKIHCNLGDLPHLDAEFTKLFVEETAMSPEEHRELATNIQNWWKSLS